MEKRHLAVLTAAVFFASAALFFTGCSSVFSAGITGKIVDAESATEPKEGIANIEVYAYTDSKTYEADYSNWNGKDRFRPTNTTDFFGHATTSSDGSFSISKVTWKNFFPKYGKTADYCQVYFLFYHEDYGLIKCSNIATVLSDATSNTVYQELTKTRSSTQLTVNVRNAVNDTNIADTVNAVITVPQNGAASKVYKETITGTSTVRISYPRYSSGTTEYTPTISITVSQSGNDVVWKQCNYITTPGSTDYSFSTNPITATISGKTASANVYVKARKISVPQVNGRYSKNSSADDDGKIVELNLSGDSGATYTINAGKTTTYPQAIGPQSTTETHGNFTGLGTGYSWIDDTYTAKQATIMAQAKVTDTAGVSLATQNLTISSDMTGSINLSIK